MKLFRVYSCDDRSKPVEYMGVFRAENKEEARKIAGTYWGDKEIYTTGFYGAEEINEKELNNYKIRLRTKLKFETEILND